jgi:predicted nucleic acid-binding protein
MVAAAMRQGCAALLTKDLQHGPQIGAVHIVKPLVIKPFVSGPERLDA